MFKLFLFFILLFFILLFIIYNNTNKIRKENFQEIKNKPISFLHIPKNGGMSMKKYFSEMNVKQHYNSYPNKNEINIGIIRNPITRLQSIFSHIKYRDTEIKNSNDLHNFNTLDELATAYYDKNNIHYQKAHNILDWDMVKFKNYKNLENKNRGSCINNNNLPCIHWAPQHLYIEGHNANVEHIMKFETLNDDIKTLQKKKILNNINFTDNKIINKTPDKYKKLTTITPICEKLINDVYKRDIELWNQL